jgi:hypothetical protein
VTAEAASAPHRTIDFRYSPSTVWTAICRPDDPYKTLVREDGALLYDLIADRAVWGFTRVVSFSVRSRLSPVAVEQSTENARTPIVRTTVRYPHVTLDLTAFARLDDQGRRADVVIWEIHVPADGEEFLAQFQVTAQERTRLFSGPTNAPSGEVYALDTAAVPTTTVLEALLVGSLYDDATQLRAGELAFISVPHPLAPSPADGFGPIPTLATEGTLLQPGECLRGALVFPLNFTDVADIDLAWAGAALEAERAWWWDYELFPHRIEIPDPAVMAMIESCARNILQAREIVDGLPEFRVGSAIFRGLWVVDGHFILEAAQYLGWHDDARAALGTLLRRSHADGAIAEMPYHIKETAIALATFVRQSELTGDDDQLRRLWPNVLRGVAYIEGLRQQAYAMPADSPAHGLLPPAFADGGIGGRRAEYTSTFWTLAGLKSIAGAARRLGFTADADRFRRLFDDLMTDFRTHAARDTRHLPDGTPYLPTVMPGSGDHTWTADYPGTPPVWRQIHPQTGTWALAQAIFPGEVFAPDDPLVQNFLALLDAVDDEEGIPCNTAFWTYRMVWTYSTSFNAHAWLYAGRGDKAADYLYAYANHAAPTRVWREEQPLRGNHALLLGGDMPHNWASAEFIRLVRHLLVLERGETLELLAGLPTEWLVPGSPLRLEATPTRFGPISVELASDPEGTATLVVERDLDWPRQPDRVLLRLPDAGSLVSAIDRDTGGNIDARPDKMIELPVAARVSLRLEPADGSPNGG